MYTDQTIICSDCSKEFVFTTGEQEFFAQKGFTNKPGRCPDCRAARKAAGGGGGRSANRYGGGERRMYTATCSSCGGVAEVPFQPSGDKPVYCRDCFRQQRAYR